VAGDGNDWHSLLAGSLREGGFHYYALDITNPSGFSPVGGLGSPLPYPGYLWEFPDEGDTRTGPTGPLGDTGFQQWVGETWGKPVITKVKLDVDGNAGGPFERWVVIVTGGYHDTADPNPIEVTGIAASNYDSSGDGTAARSIFMLDAKNGDVIAIKRYVDGAATAEGDMKFSVVAKPSVVDINSDGYADIIYFVDMGGQVFKWVINPVGYDRVNDMSGDPTDQPDWPFKLFFKANHPDTSPPIGDTTISGTDYYLNMFYSPAVAYSGGQLWLAFGTGERRSLAFEGVSGSAKENNRYYVVSDADPYEFLSLPTLEESDLMDLTADEDGANVTGRGFFFKIGDGEKFVTNTEIFAGHVIAATFKPEDTGDPCTSRGVGTLYVFDLLTGEGYFDDGGGNPTRGLDIGAGLPSDPQVSVGVGGEDNKVIIEQSGTEILEIEEEDINASGGLLYWREKL
jgi:type IV pilus assembly protein PilY1